MEEKNILTKVIEKFHNIVCHSSYEGMVYITGSCIRNTMLNKEVRNIEIVVENESKAISFARWITQVEGCYLNNMNPVVDLQKDLAIFKLLNDAELADITFTCKTTRKLLYCNGILTQGSYGTLKDDYKQRDVTINALYYDVTNNSVLDVESKSCDDLKNKVLRCTSDPDETFKKDPLKILRIIRLSIETGFGIDKDTWISMIANTHKIVNVPQEIITQEINKTLLVPKPSLILRKMICCNNILEYAIPSLYDLNKITKSYFPPTSLLNFTLKVVDNSVPTVAHRLAALFHAIGEIGGEYNFSLHVNASESCQIAELILKSMKYPKNIVDKVSGAILLQNSFSQLKTEKELPSNKTLRELKRLCGDDFDFVLDTIDALNKSEYPTMKSKQIKYIREKFEKIKEKDEKHMHESIQINGKDIVNEFKIKPGAIVGELMTKLRKEFKRRGFMTREECLSFVNSELILMDSKV